MREKQGEKSCTTLNFLNILSDLVHTSPANGFDFLPSSFFILFFFFIPLNLFINLFLAKPKATSPSWESVKVAEYAHTLIIFASSKKKEREKNAVQSYQMWHYATSEKKKNQAKLKNDQSLIKKIVRIKRRTFYFARISNTLIRRAGIKKYGHSYSPACRRKDLPEVFVQIKFLTANFFSAFWSQREKEKRKYYH